MRVPYHYIDFRAANEKESRSSAYRDPWLVVLVCAFIEGGDVCSRQLNRQTVAGRELAKAFNFEE